MKNESEEDIDKRHRLLRSDPHRYLELVNEAILRAPRDSSAYFARHFGWIAIGNNEKALEDLNTALTLEPASVVFHARGLCHVRLKRFDDALFDFATAKSLDPEVWEGFWGPVYEAHCHAQLGNEAEAMAACDALPDDHWSRGLHGAPGGTKEEITEAIREHFSSRRGNSP